MSFLETGSNVAQALWAPVLLTQFLLLAVGLVSVWAALSRRHWFLRALAVATVVGPTAVIPGHDVVLVFMLQSLLAIVGIRLCIALRIVVPKEAAEEEREPKTDTKDEPQAKTRTFHGRYPRFSLLDLMLMVVVVSALCAVLAPTPRHIWVEWPAILIAAALFAFLAWVTTQSVGVFMSWRGPKWFFGKPIRGKKDLFWRVCGLVVYPLMLAPYAVVYHKAINPIPLPSIALPDPNGHPELIRIGQTLLDPGVPNPYDATPEQLADFAAANPEVVDAIRLALDHESLVPLTYTSADLNRSYKPLQAVAWALAAEGQSSQADGRIADAVTNYLDILRVAETSARGGLATDAVYGNSSEYLAVYRLARILQDLPTTEARRVIAALQAMEARREPLEAIVTREGLWWHHATGKTGRAIEALTASPLILEKESETESQSNSRKHHQARLQLMVSELAIRAYRLDHNRLPDKLADLVPTYLDAVPIDPYSRNPIIYRPNPTGPILYSVGPNGRDDGGEPMEKMSYQPTYPGDLLLIEPEDAAEESDPQ